MGDARNAWTVSGIESNFDLSIVEEGIFSVWVCLCRTGESTVEVAVFGSAFNSPSLALRH